MERTRRLRTSETSRDGSATNATAYRGYTILPGTIEKDGEVHFMFACPLSATKEEAAEIGRRVIDDAVYRLGACVHDPLLPCPSFDGRECDVCPLASGRPIIIRLREILAHEAEAKASAELVPSHEDAIALAAALGVHCMFDRPNAVYVFRRTPFDQNELGESRKVLR